MSRITLTLTPAQATAVAEALSLSARLGMGQYGELVDHWLADQAHFDAATLARRDQLRAMVEDLRDVAMPELERGSYWSVNSNELNERHRVACDVERAIRHAQYRARAAAHPGYDVGGVYAYPPTPRSVEGIPEVRVEGLDARPRKA